MAFRAIKARALCRGARHVARCALCAHTHARPHTRRRAHARTHTRAGIHTRSRAHARRHTHAGAHTRAHIHAGAHTRAHIHAGAHTHTQARTRAHTHTQARTHAHTRARARARAGACARGRAGARAGAHVYKGRPWKINLLPNPSTKILAGGGAPLGARQSDGPEGAGAPSGSAERGRLERPEKIYCQSAHKKISALCYLVIRASAHVY